MSVVQSGTEQEGQPVREWACLWEWCSHRRVTDLQEQGVHPKEGSVPMSQAITMAHGRRTGPQGHRQGQETAGILGRLS